MKGRTLMPAGIFVALLVAAIPAQAQSNSGFYIGAGLGTTKLESRQLTASLPPQVLTVKDSSSSVRVFAGYRAMRYLFLEAGMISYGNAKERLGSGSDQQQVEIAFGGYDLSIIANAPLASDAFDIFARIGVARHRYDSLVFDATDPGFAVDARSKDSQTSAVYGVGAQFNFGADKSNGIRIEYNSYDVSLLASDQSNVLVSYVHRFSR